MIHRTWYTLININNMWNFNSLLRVCLALHIRSHELQKASGITPWKMLLATALALFITGCSTDVYCSNKPAAVAPKESNHHFFVSGIVCRKTVDAASKFVAAQKMLLKQKTQQTFVNGLLGFITLGIYTPARSACVLLTQLHELPIDMGNSICTAH